MVIKWSPGGEYAGGWRRQSTSNSTCVVLAWTLTSENASFGVRARWWLHQLTSDPKRCFLFWKCLQMVGRLRGLVWKQIRCHPGGHVRLSWKPCGASCTRASCGTHCQASCRTTSPTECVCGDSVGLSKTNQFYPLFDTANFCKSHKRIEAALSPN